MDTATLTDPATIIQLCQWTGAVGGVCGAWAVGSQTPRWRFWGFTGFAVSNFILIAAFWLMHSWPLLGMQTVFLLTSVRGMRSNFYAWARERGGVGHPLRAPYDYWMSTRTGPDLRS